MATRPRAKCEACGFTLLEMSIVLVIIGTVIAASTVLFNNYIKQSQYRDTQAKLAVIQKALYDYRRAYDRLPCPADVTIGLDSINYYSNGLLFGAEAQPWFNNYLENGYGCYDRLGTLKTSSANIIDDVYNSMGGNSISGGGPDGGNPAGTMVVEGMVPTRTLGLPDDYAIDGWGRKIMYAVDATATSPSLTRKIPLPDPGLPITASGVFFYQQRITILPTGYTGTYKTNYALYALISFGADGHGGWPKNSFGIIGSVANIPPVDTGSTNVYQLVNCNCDPNNPYSLRSLGIGNYPTNSNFIYSTYDPPAFNYGSNTIGVKGGFIGTFDYSNNPNVNLQGLSGTPSFVQGPPTQDSATPDGTNDFDDIVVYATRADLPGYRE